ncbi:hypothetical protein [Saccharopolyspora rosea]|uniref:Uncharacterized protein n=1 Tax=Saccharopolyspora rosea TaxID=524884 RepID=A0ABW3FPD9_9PSEU|nr:hypothetical protein [Saccharopolyspora rosea]
MRRIITALATAAVLATVTQYVISLVNRPVPSPTPPAVQHCEEDQPCWDCHTMGNHRCGPTRPETPATRAENT